MEDKLSKLLVIPTEIEVICSNWGEKQQIQIEE